VNGEKEKDKSNRHSVGPGILEARSYFDGQASEARQARSRTTTAPTTAPLPSTTYDTSPGTSCTTRTSWLDPTPNVNESGVDEDIEKRVLEMAGLGLGSLGLLDAPHGSGRRVKSEGVDKLKVLGEEISRSKSANDDGAATLIPSQEEIPDMRMLRRIAELSCNSKCADCGKGMKSSRWATLSKFT